MWRFHSYASEYTPTTTTPDPDPKDPPETPPTTDPPVITPPHGEPPGRDRPRGPYSPLPKQFPVPSPPKVKPGQSSDATPRWGTAATQERMSSASSHRALPIAHDLFDWRYAPETEQDARTLLDSMTPVTMRMDTFGAQGGAVGGPYMDGVVEWDYTQRPARSRHPGGSSNGGRVFMPPEVGLEDIDDDFAPDGVDLSTTILLAAPGACFGVGTPELATGGMRDGVSFCVDSDGNMPFYSHDSNGAKTQVAYIGDGGLVRTVVTTGIDYSVAVGVDVVLCTVPVTTTLPIAAAYEGRSIDVKSAAAGATVTLASDGGFIDSEVTQTIDDFECITVISDGTDWWIL